MMPKILMPYGLLLFLAAMPEARAADPNNPNWPCIQRKVPEISAGMVWAGPPVGEESSGWRQSAEIAALVQRLSQRRISLEEANADIDRFAETRAGDKGAALTLLFAGLLQTINRERSEIMAGIEKYAGRQRALADRIKADSARLTALLRQEELSGEDEKTLETLEEKLAWDSRVFDEREQSLTYVCESPVLLEQRIFALARQIMTHLE